MLQNIVLMRLSSKGKCISVYIDVNGAKKPNIIGRDTFLFGFYPIVNDFVPYGIYLEDSYDEETKNFKRVPSEEINQECGGGGVGIYCAARILQDGFKINY